MLSANDGWAAGFGATILHWDGNSWTAMAGLPSAWLQSVDMASPAGGWAVGDGSMLLRYRYLPRQVYLPALLR